MNAEQVRRLLEKQVKVWGTQRELARVIGVSPALLNAILSGKRIPAGKPVAFLGLERKTVFIRKTHYIPIANVSGIAQAETK